MEEQKNEFQIELKEQGEKINTFFKLLETLKNEKGEKVKSEEEKKTVYSTTQTDSSDEKKDGYYSIGNSFDDN